MLLRSEHSTFAQIHRKFENCYGCLFNFLYLKAPLAGARGAKHSSQFRLCDCRTRERGRDGPADPKAGIPASISADEIGGNCGTLRTFSSKAGFPDLQSRKSDLAISDTFRTKIDPNTLNAPGSWRTMHYPCRPGRRHIKSINCNGNFAADCSEQNRPGRRSGH